MREFRIAGGSSHSALHPSKEIIVTSHTDSTLYLTEFDTDNILSECNNLNSYNPKQ